jgi:hypothetical protein
LLPCVFSLEVFSSVLRASCQVFILFILGVDKAAPHVLQLK